MRKKFLVTVATALSVVMLTACGGKDNNDTNTTPTPSVTEAPDASPEATPETTPEVTPDEKPDSQADVNQMLQNIHQAVQEQYGSVYPSGMQMQEDETFMQETLNLDASWYDAAIVEVPMMSMSVDTFAVIHATEGNLENVKNALKGYQDYLINDSFQYPMNMPKVQASVTDAVGDYVYFVILSGLADVSQLPEDGGEEDMAAQIDVYKASNQFAIDTITGVVNGDIVVTPWTEMQKLLNAVKKAYGNTYLPRMQCQDDENFMKEVLKLDPSWCNDVIVEVPMISAQADILVLVDASEGNLENVQNALKAYKDYLVNEALQYPMNEPRVKSAVIETVGNYVCFSILGGAVDDPESMGLNTDEDLISYYESMNMNAVYAVMQYTGIFE